MDEFFAGLNQFLQDNNLSQPSPLNESTLVTLPPRMRSGADPGRNLTRAQQKDRGRGYMGVENIP